MLPNVFHVNAVNIAVGTAIFFAIGSSAIVQAATKQEIALCKAITDKAQRLDCFKSLKIKVQKTQGAKLGETPNVKTPAYPVVAPFPQPQETTKVLSTPSPAVAAPDEPASTGSIDRLSGTPGRPLCGNLDALAAMLVAGVLASNPAQATTIGCHIIPDDANVELLQRFPSGFQFLRTVKVRVTSPTQPEPSIGYTIEIGR